MKRIYDIGIFVSLLGIVACAPDKPPQDLVSARAAYDRANEGPAATLNPSGLDTAKKRLDAAEASFDKYGDTQETRDEAYLALRKTEQAESVARARKTDQAKAATVDEMHADETKTVAATSAELARTRGELAEQGAANTAQNVAYSVQGAELEEEKARRAEAEKRAQQAAADLAKFASVKQETRGMVITLSGGVLFISAKADLLPSAKVKLNEVANALIKEDPLSKIVVEGHTDSQGSADYNQELSQRRASNVRDYLVERGIASDRITAQGFGFTRSIAANDSEEGRANNRRVEIVVKPGSVK